MEKNQNTTPDPKPQKIIRNEENLSIAVTEEEELYRKDYGPDNISQVDKKKVKCTVCFKSLKHLTVTKKNSHIYVHKVLDVLVCKGCYSFQKGNYSIDEQDKHCRWCAKGENGENLYICSACSCSFCEECMNQNLSRQDLKDLKSDDWRCVICNPKPLYESRTICWLLLTTSRKKIEESQEKVPEKGEASHKTSQEVERDFTSQPPEPRRRHPYREGEAAVDGTNSIQSVQLRRRLFR